MRYMAEELTVATGTIGFQDAKGLQRMNETITDSEMFTHRFYIDGPFEKADTKFDSSQDGSIKVAESFGADIAIMPFASEFDKRMKYLEMCRKHNIDFLLIIDTDEFLLRYDKERFLPHLQEIKDSGTDHNTFAVMQQPGNTKYGVPVEVRKLQLNERPRLWFKPGDMTYVRGSHAIFKNINHDKWYYPGTKMVDMSQTIKGIWLAEDKTHRSEARNMLQKNYVDNVLIPKELEILKLQAIENLPGMFF
jgi:hypothetical protein